MHIASLKAAIEKCCPHLQVRGLTPINEGWDSCVLDVNGQYIFRFPRRPDVEVQLAKEMRLLPELAAALPVQVPVFEHVCHSTDLDATFAGYPKIQGVPLTRQALSQSHVADIAAQLGHVLASLHAFPTDRAVELGVPPATPEQWRDEYLSFYQWVCHHVSPLLDSPVWDRVRRLWEDFLSNPCNFQFRPALVHRDLGVEHILFDQASGMVAGVIDWGDAAIGDPAIDFVGLLLEHGDDLVRLVLAHYGGHPGPNFWERATFYASIGPFHEIKYGLDINEPRYLRTGVEGVNAWSAARLNA